MNEKSNVLDHLTLTRVAVSEVIIRVMEARKNSASGDSLQCGWGDVLEAICEIEMELADIRQDASIVSRFSKNPKDLGMKPAKGEKNDGS